MVFIVIAFLISLVLTLAIIPTLAVLARRVGLVDHPDNNRKLHLNAIPMVGGLALFVATPVTSFLVIYWAQFYPDSVAGLTSLVDQWLPLHYLPSVIVAKAQDIHELWGLLIAAAILLVVGLADDRFNIRGRQKLIGQIVAVTVLILFGYKFEHLIAFRMQIEFGVFSGLVVYLWILAAINSVNLLDGADGIASTVGIVMSLSICAMAIVLGRPVDAIIAATIAGTLVGFLRFNFPPAKAYLGDSGSMLIGLLLSGLAIRCMFKQSSAYAFFAPIALLAIPFIDTGAAIIRRRLTGRSIFAVDRGHLHHALAKRGYSPRVSLLWVGLLCATTAAGGVLTLAYQRSEYALVSIMIVLVVMIACRIFGLAEYQLVTRRANSLARSIFHMTSRDMPDVLQSSVHVQGNRDWQDVWKQFCDFAEEHQLNQLTLDLNAPWMHESFHATRRRADVNRGENKEWYSLLPLVVEGRCLGRVEIHGSHSQRFSHSEVICNLLKVMADVEQTVVEPLRNPASSGLAEISNASLAGDRDSNLVDSNEDSNQDSNEAAITPR